MATAAARVRAFLTFWYDFVVGDDWRMALGVLVTLAVTYGASRSTVAVWWITPVAVVGLLSWSLLRTTRRP